MTFCQPVVNGSLLVELFDNRHPITVYRWLSDQGPGKRFAPADLVVGGVKLWNVETVLSWASDRNERVNPRVLERILSEQS